MSAEVVCCIYLQTLLTYVSIEANIVDPVLTAPTGEVSTLFAKDISADKNR